MRKSTFWFAVLSLIIIIHNKLGHDDKNFIIGLSNPVLFKIVYVESVRNILWDEVLGKPKICLYIGHF